MDQFRKFGEQTSRILEFKPEGLEGQYYITANFISRIQMQTGDMN